jgi:hypothetical protein
MEKCRRQEDCYSEIPVRGRLSLHFPRFPTYCGNGPLLIKQKVRVSIPPLHRGSEGYGFAPGTAPGITTGSNVKSTQFIGFTIETTRFGSAFETGFASYISKCAATFVFVASTYAYVFAQSNADAMGGYESMTRSTTRLISPPGSRSAFESEPSFMRFDDYMHIFLKKPLFTCHSPLGLRVEMLASNFFHLLNWCFNFNYFY